VTRLKLAAINVLIALGAFAIAYIQWPEALRSSGFGSGGYNQGMIGTVLLFVLMAGIPIIIFAIVLNLGLTWLLFRPGELEEYKARKLIEDLAGKKDAAPETPKSQHHDFAD
jgi:hypothetical protein